MSRRPANAPPERLDPPLSPGAGPRPTGDKLGVLIARQIEAEVLRGGLQVGQSLGSEPSLMSRYKVSRSSLREAIRQLETHGLVKMIRGINGGLMVADLPQRAAARALTIHLELLDADVDELFEALRILEPMGARLAAERAREPELARLTGILDELEASPPNVDAVVPLHFAIRNQIGVIATNPALAMFVHALNRFTVERLVPGGAPSTAEVARRADYMRRIVDAIVAHAPEEAESAMRADVDDRYGLLSRYFAEHAGYGVPSVGALETTPSGARLKLSLIVAMTIAHEIKRRGLAAGDKLGAEPDLLAKYGISRAVFREAIRILEVHGFVRTRRGNLGGLMVSEPGPAYVIESTLRFLRAAGMSRIHFVEIRKGVAIEVVRMAAERIDDKGRARLAEALEAHLVSPSENVVPTAVALHSLIGDLSGNRALAVFNSILLELSSDTAMILREEVAHQVKAHTTRICEAVAAGDGALACQRLIEHIEEFIRWPDPAEV